VSVYLQKDRKAYTYEFVYKAKSYKGSTGQITKEAAELYEQKEQDRVRRTVAGLTDLRDAPAFQEWAGVYYNAKETGAGRIRKVKRPEMVDMLVTIVLRFFGRRPTDPSKVVEGEPYHDYTLADPILKPEILDDFEDWMESHRYSGSHRNHLRTQVSGMYRVAMLPKFRRRTGVTMNPMEGVPRDRRVVRDVELSVEQLQAWLAHASYHVRLAMAIAALAPKLRLANVLALEWRTHVDSALTRITVADHKTDASGRPIKQGISDQLRNILQDAARRNRGRWVVAYRGKRVKSIRGGVESAAARAGIVYGRDLPAGATFHTIRHAVATWFAEMEELSEPMRAALLNQTDIQTTQGYTHLRPVRERKHLERLSAQTPVAAIVTQPWRRWSKGRTPLAPPIAEEKREESAHDSAEKPRQSPMRNRSHRGRFPR
jgi:integrase